MKFAAKGLERNAKKSEKEEREEKTKLKRVCLRWLRLSLNGITLVHGRFVHLYTCDITDKKTAMKTY